MTRDLLAIRSLTARLRPATPREWVTGRGTRSPRCPACGRRVGLRFLCYYLLREGDPAPRLVAWRCLRCDWNHPVLGDGTSSLGG